MSRSTGLYRPSIDPAVAFVLKYAQLACAVTYPYRRSPPLGGDNDRLICANATDDVTVRRSDAYL
jgi:hypothetical protein